MTNLTAAERRHIAELVKHYNQNKDKFSTLLYQLHGYVSGSRKLADRIHSVKQRVKDPDHLRAKLERKTLKAKESRQTSTITIENLFKEINDLAGFRIIHLHTRQIEDIDRELRAIFEEQRWILIEGPVAKTWDDESRAYFESLGWTIENSANMYTSVHYVVQPNSRSEITCEIQVRTLMEEVWGEVDHTINYPVKSVSLSCREQIKVLARLTSSCSRLVDSIFLSNSDVSPDLHNRPLKDRTRRQRPASKRP